MKLKMGNSSNFGIKKLSPENYKLLVNLTDDTGNIL